MLIESIKKGLQFLWEENWKFKEEAETSTTTTNKNALENQPQTDTISVATPDAYDVLPESTTGIDHSIESIRRAHQAGMDLVAEHPEFFGGSPRNHTQDTQE